MSPVALVVRVLSVHPPTAVSVNEVYGRCIHNILPYLPAELFLEKEEMK